MAETYKIVEGIESTWHYHLARIDADDFKSLCGAKTMATEIPLRTWGMKGHVPSYYCKECERLSSGLAQ